MVLILSFSDISDLERLATELEFVHEEFPRDSTRTSIRLAYSRVANLTGLSSLINNLHRLRYSRVASITRLSSFINNRHRLLYNRVAMLTGLSSLINNLQRLLYNRVAMVKRSHQPHQQSSQAAVQ